MPVYLIQKGADCIYKVGYSKDPLKRLKQLQTGSSEKLTLIATLVHRIRPDAVVEKEIKKALSKYRVSGEWFFLDKQLLDVLIKAFDWRINDAIYF